MCKYDSGTGPCGGSSFIVEGVTFPTIIKPKNFFDRFELFSYRKALSLQLRSVVIATSLFLPNSIVIGIPIMLVDVDLIFESCKNIWDSWGLDINEFEFLLRKDALICYRQFEFLDEPLDILGCIKVLVWSEMNDIFTYESMLFLGIENLNFVL